ncbi:anthranilate phosphoribosyltransferase [Hyphomonas neptunium ATCC 15444]|uniref:Anthranilate phosphoribosyltransferase n=2 Tax=Hyphomonas TaxID=85 RepID=TRPD_HYPNA|nr:MULTISPECIES: anthranilate phosphoribosyltransferase [Hyphomonas]Q0C1A1.1 RecName: Full=Anthranilate phosphoribosyltransferase [Hyphomonas neptunium ATCC 15444]ABI75412.1 anthranilate phosphoribosyltransferase [Hyphomonas neptunium ATCC 15444]KCZ95095.1 anthranilate phosphoribosyltransferase [Hyphomonas hirschiana VP5]
MSESALNTAIQAIARGLPLEESVLEGAFDTLLSGEAAPEEVGAFLAGLTVRGETANELIAGARIMRRHGRSVSVEGPLLDTCGTGGLPWKSLNTSTASAIVIAAAGGRVAKHGNRSVPPKTGSADVLEALGLQLELSDTAFKSCLEIAGVGFLFARSYHSAMRHVAPIRHKLGIRTIFNLLGPLSNPAGAEYSVLGVYDKQWVTPMAEALKALGTRCAWVVHGLAGIDEISISGPTDVCEVTPASIRHFQITPSDAGLPSHPLSTLEGGAPEENTAAIRDLLDGREGPFRDIVLINAAAGLHVSGMVADLPAGVQRAAQAIDSGAARETLNTLVRTSRESD